MLEKTEGYDPTYHVCTKCNTRDSLPVSYFEASRARKPFTCEKCESPLIMISCLRNHYQAMLNRMLAKQKANIETIKQFKKESIDNYDSKN